MSVDRESPYMADGERTEEEKDDLLARLAEDVDDPALSRIFELASQASSPSTEESN